jgi:chromosome segregation ATPase
MTEAEKKRGFWSRLLGEVDITVEGEGEPTARQVAIALSHELTELRKTHEAVISERDTALRRAEAAEQRLQQVEVQRKYAQELLANARSEIARLRKQVHELEREAADVATEALAVRGKLADRERGLTAARASLRALRRAASLTLAEALGDGFELAIRLSGQSLLLASDEELERVTDE